MSDVIIYTEEETAQKLRIGEETLRNLRRRHRIRGFRQGRGWFYRPQHIEEYLKACEGKCGESQSSSNSGTETENIFPTGTSSITKEEVNALLRGTELARKTMKRTSRSRSLSSTGKNQQQESLTS